eukprot:49461-Chlamydomonas_euryale.AAC.1
MASQAADRMRAARHGGSNGVQQKQQRSRAGGRDEKRSNCGTCVFKHETAFKIANMPLTIQRAPPTRPRTWNKSAPPTHPPTIHPVPSTKADKQRSMRETAG